MPKDERALLQGAFWPIKRGRRMFGGNMKHVRRGAVGLGGCAKSPRERKDACGGGRNELG